MYRREEALMMQLERVEEGVEETVRKVWEQ